jgi:hypothetical protein
VRSTLGARKAENKAWSEGNFDASNEAAYPLDSPTDYVVEPTEEAKLHFTPTLVQKRAFAYNGYPVRSTLGARKAENKAWSDGNFDASNEVAYPLDSPTDYVVEPTAEADLHNSGLVQKRSFAYNGYPVRSTLGARKAENKAWSEGNFDASNEVAYPIDSPTDYVVEPTAEADLHNSGLV